MAFIVKNTTFPSLLDLLSPHSCRGCGRLGEAFCECCKNHIMHNRNGVCEKFKDHKNLPPIYTVSSREGVLGELIHDYKYYSIKALAKPLAEMMSESLPVRLPQNSILVPLPTATHHVRARGFDHMYLIAKNLSKIRKIPVGRMLVRNKNTVQVGANRKERLSQANLAYDLNPRVRIDKDKTYILLDDVWTTGASIEAAVKKLRAGGAKCIIIAVIAYSS